MNPSPPPRPPLHHFLTPGTRAIPSCSRHQPSTTPRPSPTPQPSPHTGKMGGPAPRGRPERQSGPTVPRGKNPDRETSQSGNGKRVRTCLPGVLAVAERCLRGPLEIVANCPFGVSTRLVGSDTPAPVVHGIASCRCYHASLCI
ncbi:hypothetical protein E2C01_037967 [Portunus trituberculatus]|uniref:Uncharacterized protein n=1 Tax=Portunus trituberculatus TaxID=210409 RepID=A0A5B7FIL7_PORTR|nr:hypothetical protein [Portunus trituberculatus]